MKTEIEVNGIKLIKNLGYIYPSVNCKYKTTCGLFLCPICGREFVTAMGRIRSGIYKSCGCAQSVKPKKHPYNHTKIYRSWKNAKNRCYNSKDKFFSDYGGRGIKMCEEWVHNPVAFCEWAFQNGYKDELKLDRINPNGDYEPSNCRFVDNNVNAQNTRILRKDNSSGYRGLIFCKRQPKRPWKAIIEHKKERYVIGSFTTKELAAQAYNNFVIENKTNHPLNIIPCQE